MEKKIWSKDFVLLTVSNFLMCITYYSLISTLPIFLVSELHAGESMVGIVLASYTIASVTIRPFTGFALDRFGRRTIFLISLILYAISFNGYLVASTVIFLIILRFAQGITWGVVTISASTVAVDIIPPEKRGEGIGYFGLSTTIGMSVGPVIGLFVFHHFGYTVMFLAASVTGIASFICASNIKMPSLAVSENPVELNWHNLFDRTAVMPSLNLLIIMITYGGLLSFIALFGREIGIKNTSLFFLVFSIGIAASRIVSGKSFDKNGPARILTICLLLLIVSFPVLALVKNAVGFYLSAITIGFGIGVVFPTFQAMVNNMAADGRRGAANSTLYTCLDIGMGCGMIIMGVISEHASISAAFLVCALICALGLFFFRRFVVRDYAARVMSLK